MKKGGFGLQALVITVAFFILVGVAGYYFVGGYFFGVNDLLRTYSPNTEGTSITRDAAQIVLKNKDGEAVLTANIPPRS